MSEFTKFLLLNIGKLSGALLGLLAGLFIIWFGLLNTLMVAALILLGLIIGKWFDEGVSFTRIFKQVISSLKINRWH